MLLGILELLVVKSVLLVMLVGVGRFMGIVGNGVGLDVGGVVKICNKIFGVILIGIFGVGLGVGF